jgi:2-isopropylmalate synthase
VTEGTDAQAEVSVRLAGSDGRLCTGRAADPDTLVSSAKAYIVALNKLTHARGAARGAVRVHSTH